MCRHYQLHLRLVTLSFLLISEQTIGHLPQYFDVTKNISHFFKGKLGHGVAIVLFLLLYRGTSCNPTSSFSDKIVTPACSLVNKSLSHFVEKHFES